MRIRRRPATGTVVQVADAASAAGLLLQAPPGAAPRARRRHTHLLRLRLRPGGARRGLPCAGRGGAGPLALEPRHLGTQPAVPGAPPRAPTAAAEAPSAAEAAAGRRGAAAARAGWQGQGAGAAGARVPEPVAARAPGRGVRLHRRAGDAGARHGPAHAGPRVLVFYRADGGAIDCSALAQLSTFSWIIGFGLDHWMGWEWNGISLLVTS